MPLVGSYNGWHHACYAADKFPCAGINDDCGNIPGARNSNYYVCKPCSNRAWFESKITTFEQDDVVRAEACRRLKLANPLKVHKEMRKVHAQFKARGGAIIVLGKRSDMPEVRWGKSNRFIISVKRRDHLVRTELSGTRRNIERAKRLAILRDHPYADDHLIK